MARTDKQTALPARMDAELSSLIRELSACAHQAPALIERAHLPRWSRRPLFFFLGYIAKAEGRVTESDIRYAESLIKALRLSKRQRRNAINWFQQGKSASQLPFFCGLTMRLSQRLWPAPALKTAICLCHASQLNGPPDKPRRYRCEDAIDQIGLPVGVSEDILDSYASKVWPRHNESLARPTSYQQACELLGVTRQDSLEVIKRAYRKKVSECHPDKLSQRQVSARDQSLAKDRLLAYQQAWELIKRHNTARHS